MRVGEGVEWAAHVCVLLHWLEGEGSTPVPGARLAGAFGLPAAYLGKQLQALTKAGITISVPGKNGGFKLARPADTITMMDVVAAIEGPGDAFRCTEIRRHGINQSRPAREFAQPCDIAVIMRQAEVAWRRSLAATTIADIGAGVSDRVIQRTVRHFAPD